MIEPYRDPHNPSTYLLCLQFFNLTRIPDAAKDKFLQKLWKKVVSSWNHQIDELIFHFLDDSVERKLLSCVSNWFNSGEMSRQQFNKWKKLAKLGQENNVESLKDMCCKEEKHAVEHVTLLQSILNQVPGENFKENSDYKQLLASFFRQPQFKLTDNDSKLKVTSKGMFLSDIVGEILRRKISSVKEVNIYAPSFFGIDYKLGNDDWHGTNLTIVADKITVWKKSAINVSGRSSFNYSPFLSANF